MKRGRKNLRRANGFILMAAIFLVVALILFLSILL